MAQHTYYYMTLDCVSLNGDCLGVPFAALPSGSAACPRGHADELLQAHIVASLRAFPGVRRPAHVRKRATRKHP
jgi:hypothetical protein